MNTAILIALCVMAAAGIVFTVGYVVTRGNAGIRRHADWQHPDRIGLDEIGDVTVSTVALRLSTEYVTEIFGTGPLDGEVWTWPTAAQARDGHRMVVDALRDGFDPRREVAL